MGTWKIQAGVEADARSALWARVSAAVRHPANVVWSPHPGSQTLFLTSPCWETRNEAP